MARLWSGRGSTDYQPVTITTFWLEWRLFKLNPLGYHVDNILLHAIDAVLLWMVLRELNVPGAWVGALLFALHPVSVASAAWISERKNTLSMFFYLLSGLLYLRFERRPRALLYAASLTLFALALLAKGAVVMLPVILLLLAWWRRGSIGGSDVRRALPFFALSALMGVVTIWFQYHRTMAGTEVPVAAIGERIARAGQNVWFYLFKAMAPVGLVAIYPRWPIGGPVVRFVPLAVLMAIAALLWRNRERWGRAPFLVMAYYILSLLPVLGLVRMAFLFYSPVADHFQYLAIAGLLAGVAAAASKLPKRWSTVAAVAALVPLGAATWRQTHDYADAETLFRAVVERDPGSYAGHKLLGLALAGKERYREADEHFTTAISLRARNGDARHEYGRSLTHQRRVEEAAAQFRQAIAAGPVAAEYHNDLGIALLQLGKPAEALSEMEQALHMDPDYSHAHVNIATILARLGRMDEAAAHLHEALRIAPEDAHAHDTLGLILMQQGNYKAAVDHFNEAVRIDPGFGAARDHLYNAEVMKARSLF